MNHPEHLYHYTTVDNLEKILENRTFRLNSLDRMDDPAEEWSKDDTECGKICFISSWTGKAEEDPKMWNDYCRPSHTRGVRLRMSPNIFSKDENHLTSYKEVIRNCFWRELEYIQKLNLYRGPETFLPEINKVILEEMRSKYPEQYQEMNQKNDNEIHNSLVYQPSSISNDMLFKVTYTEDEDLLFPRIHHFTPDGNYATFDKFGRAKRTKWSWQEEWRYMLFVTRFVPGCNHTNTFVTMYPSVEYVDLIIDKDAFHAMEITTSPTITADAKDKLLKIVDHFNPTAIIKKSSISAESVIRETERKNNKYHALSDHIYCPIATPANRPPKAKPAL